MYVHVKCLGGDCWGVMLMKDDGTSECLADETNSLILSHDTAVRVGKEQAKSYECAVKIEPLTGQGNA